METKFKFYGKNVNQGRFADYVYIGSMFLHEETHRELLIRHAESIGGPVNGPLIAVIDDCNVKVLKV